MWQIRSLSPFLTLRNYLPTQMKDSRPMVTISWNATQCGRGEKAYINKEALHFSEWAMLKQLISKKYREKSCKQFLVLISTGVTLMMLFPNFSKLASIARILPISTAECERCFSAMKRVKTVLRNRLETVTLERLLRISLEGRTSIG